MPTILHALITKHFEIAEEWLWFQAVCDARLAVGLGSNFQDDPKAVIIPSLSKFDHPLKVSLSSRI
jgi:hypothetical protein